MPGFLCVLLCGKPQRTFSSSVRVALSRRNVRKGIDFQGILQSRHLVLTFLRVLCVFAVKGLLSARSGQRTSPSAAIRLQEDGRERRPAAVAATEVPDPVLDAAVPVAVRQVPVDALRRLVVRGVRLSSTRHQEKRRGFGVGWLGDWRSFLDIA